MQSGRWVFRSALWGVVCVLAFVSVEVLAAPSSRYGDTISITGKRHHELRVPAKMRPRVQFWIDVFSRYGKHNAVLHHRMYPYIIFDVLDFYGKAGQWSDAKIERYRKSAIKKKTKEIKNALQRLGAGKPPRTPFEQHIQKQMSVLGSGTKKYRDAVKHDWIRSQRGIRERYRGAVERSGRYLHILEQTFVLEFGLPIELTRLPFVESSFDYKAYSSVGAAGIWQFMPATGRLYDLKVSRVVDERRDVTAATKAAARYLSDAYRKLGTWPLALTSYNHGVYGVLRKVKAAGTKDITRLVERAHNQEFGFASQNFYPEFLAALEIYEDVQKYFPGVQIEAPVHIARRKMTRTVSASELSRKLGVSLDQLRAVNYALHSQVWKGRYAVPAGYTLNVPNRYKTQLASLKLPKYVPTSSGGGVGSYRVRSGDSLGRIARRHGLSVSKLKAMNGLRSDFIRIGQVLRVGGSSGSAAASSLTYKVRSGDTLFSIARAHRTTVESLKRANGLRSSRIRIGQKLALPVGASSGRGEEVRYTVRRGDSLWKISRRFGVSQKALKTRNKLRSSHLRIGQRLYIPR
jgi:membrane-bound lytic murein transglycosylase D